MFIFKFEKLDNELDMKYGFYMVMKHFFFLFCFCLGSTFRKCSSFTPGCAQWDNSWPCSRGYMECQGLNLNLPRTGHLSLQIPSWNIWGRNVHTVTWLSLPFSINDKTIPISSHCESSLTFQPHFTLGSTASSGQHSLDSMQLKSTERTLLQGCRQGQQCPGSPDWQE